MLKHPGYIFGFSYTTFHLTVPIPCIPNVCGLTRTLVVQGNPRTADEMLNSLNVGNYYVYVKHLDTSLDFT